MSNRIKFALIFVIVGLHSFRNYSSSVYLMFYALAFLFSIHGFIKAYKKPSDKRKLWIFNVLLGVAILGFVTSLMIISVDSSAYGLVRFIFATPVFFALYGFTDNLHDLRRHVSSILIFVGLAGLTLPLQFITGPITWFADASERAGLERYSSLLGSLTTIGIVIGSYLILTQAMNRKIRVLWVIVLAVPALISLSKSALANVAIVIILLVIINRKKLSRVILGASIISVISMFTFSLSIQLRERFNALLSSVGLNQGSVINYDDSLWASLIKRLTELPLSNFHALADLHSPFVYLTGAGFGMADTALVPSGDGLAPMAHNQFAENITVFGFIGGVLLSVTMIIIFLKLWLLYKHTSQQIFLLLAISYGLFLINSLFANGTIYQPASATIFLLAMFVAIRGQELFEATDQSSDYKFR